MASKEDLISNFHSLVGIKIGERRKHLFTLLNKTQLDEEFNFDLIQPKTPLEEKFKIEILIYFKRAPELMEVLKGENRTLIDKVLKASPWFINKAFENINGEQLVNEIFPHLSYNTKLKLMNKFSLHLRSTKKSDEFFQAVKEKYGLYLASKFITACNADLIVENIEANRFEVTPKQLLVIIKKYPKLTESLFEKINKHYSKVPIAQKYKSVFKYITQTNPTLFLKLHEKYDLDIELGTRSTFKLINLHKRDIIDNPKKFFKFLKVKCLGRILKEDFQNFYCGLFPKSASKLKADMEQFFSLLRHIPSPSNKLKYFVSSFEIVYSKELWEYPIFVTKQLIMMMTADERDVWMQTHARPIEIPEEIWISLMKTEKSISVLQQKIVLTSNIKERQRLVESLVFTCKINDDMDELLNVLKYMISERRNDHEMILRSFLLSVRDSFDLSRFTEKHWKYFNEFVNLFLLNNERFYLCDYIFSEYINHCFENNQPIKDLIRDFLKLAPSRYKIGEKRPKFEKYCLLLCNEIIQFGDDEKESLAYLQCIYYWNMFHSKDQISLFINIDALKAIRSRVESGVYSYFAVDILETCIYEDLQKSEDLNLISVLFKQRYWSNQLNLVKWLIKNHPLIFLRHIEDITLNFIKMEIDAFYYLNISSYSHLEIPQKICEICLDVIKIEDNITVDDFNRKKIALSFLSYLMNPEEFVNLLQAYYPSYDATTSMKNILRFQRSILDCINNVFLSSSMLECVLNFCKSDYLKFVQRPLYSVSYNSKEVNVIPFFEKLNDCEISIKKHSIFLTFKTLNKPQIFNTFNKMANDDDSQIRKSLFKGIFNFFIRNPDDDSWKMTQNCLKKVDVNDKEAFNILTKYRRIPSSYLIRYVLFTWNVLENLLDCNEVIVKGKARILNAITADAIPLLPGNFKNQVINKYFLKSNEIPMLQNAIQVFVCRCIIFTIPEINRKRCMETALILVENYIKLTWFDLEKIMNGRKLIFNFVQELCNHFLSKYCDENDKEILKTFVTTWKDHFQPFEAFAEWLYLEFTLIYVDCQINKLTIPQAAKQIALLCDTLEDNTFLEMNVFCKTLTYCKTYFRSIDLESDPEEKELCFIDSILKTSNSVSCSILVINLLPKKVTSTTKIMHVYNSIIESLLQQKQPIVQIHLHDYLSNQ